MSGRADVDEQAEKVRVYREFVARRGRRDLGNGDYSVDPGWHTAAELLPVIDSLAAELVSLKDALRAIRANAEGFHKGEDGKERALAVIARWAADPSSVPTGVIPAAAREALGRLSA